MSNADKTKVLLGVGFLLAGTAIILFVSGAGRPIIPGVIGSLATLAMALGALLVGISGTDGAAV